jgi:FkbM family methyltransferase
LVSAFDFFAGIDTRLGLRKNLWPTFSNGVAIDQVSLAELSGDCLKLINALPFPLQVAVARSKVLARLTGTVYWGLGDLDKKLVAIIGARPGYFVELGANDGISQSNTKHLEMFHGWKGVLVEPYPGNFNKLQRTRSSSNHLENAACVSFDFPKSEMVLTYSNLMTTPMEGYSDLENRSSHAESGAKWLRPQESVTTFVARTRTLSSILDEAKAPRNIELLSLDVEGGEIEVLSGIDHEKYRFDWVVVESRDEAAIVSFFAKLGYSLHSKLSGHDYLFRQNSKLT